GLTRVGGVVEADAEDRARAQHGREQLHVGQCALLAVGGRAGARGETVEDGAGGEVDHPVAPDLAGAWVVGARDEVGGEAHWAGILRGWTKCGVHTWPRTDDDVPVDGGAIKAAAAASAASYRSFADATRSVLDLLERL